MTQANRLLHSIERYGSYSVIPPLPLRLRPMEVAISRQVGQSQVVLFKQGDYRVNALSRDTGDCAQHVAGRTDAQTTQGCQRKKDSRYIHSVGLIFGAQTWPDCGSSAERRQQLRPAQRSPLRIIVL